MGTPTILGRAAGVAMAEMAENGAASVKRAAIHGTSVGSAKLRRTIPMGTTTAIPTTMVVKVAKAAEKEAGREKVESETQS